MKPSSAKPLFLSGIITILLVLTTPAKKLAWNSR